MTATDVPVLSICIPTYNRRERIDRLVRSLLSVEGPFEVCVHVDGSTDGTCEALSQLTDERLRVTTTENKGKTAALLEAVYASSGKFVMSFDDDDTFYIDVLPEIISRCQDEIPDGIAGFIYHLDDEKGTMVGSSFPVERSNFIALRADFKVRGDKKEVVLAEILKKVAYDPCGRYRRAPPSLSWARIALTHDVICINRSVGVKRYLPGGITSKIWRTKLTNSYPMFLLRWCHIVAFFSRRYRSYHHFLRSLAAAALYGFVSLFEVRRSL